MCAETGIKLDTCMHLRLSPPLSFCAQEDLIILDVKMLVQKPCTLYMVLEMKFHNHYCSRETMR